MIPAKPVQVGSETGRLRSLLIHSPDSGLGKVIPCKAQDWLFEDIVHLPGARAEYDEYLKLLLWFLDPAKIKGRINGNRDFFKPDHPDFYNSAHVIELQVLLAAILGDPQIRAEIVASVCAIEGCSHRIQQDLLALPHAQLCKVILSGAADSGDLLFPPVPNLIFSRDIGVAVNDCILLSRPAKTARNREALLARYIFFHHSLFREQRSRILEITGNPQAFLLPNDALSAAVTLEGGDVMVVSPGHVLIGCSERTSVNGALQAAQLLFDRAGVRKVTLIHIPLKRDYMHIDTLFTQVGKDAWVLLNRFSGTEPAEETPTDSLHPLLRLEHLRIVQYEHNVPRPKTIASLETLLTEISTVDLGVTGPVKFIYSGNNEFPFDAREQWTDSCNVLALKDGVVLGYDRNDRTNQAFRDKGFRVVAAAAMLAEFEQGEADPDTLTDTLIVVPSAELSRARGGFHCMSMPLQRD